jgi:hypothetical protein
LTVLVPAGSGATSIANVRENPRIALTISHIPTHRTMQFKGSVACDGDGADREQATRYRSCSADLA